MRQYSSSTSTCIQIDAVSLSTHPIGTVVETAVCRATLTILTQLKRVQRQRGRSWLARPPSASPYGLDTTGFGPLQTLTTSRWLRAAPSDPFVSSLCAPHRFARDRDAPWIHSHIAPRQVSAAHDCRSADLPPRPAYCRHSRNPSPHRTQHQEPAHKIRRHSSMTTPSDSAYSCYDSAIRCSMFLTKGKRWRPPLVESSALLNGPFCPLRFLSLFFLQTALSPYDLRSHRKASA